MTVNSASEPLKRPITLIVVCVFSLLLNSFLIAKGVLVYWWLDSTSDDRRKDAIVAIDLFYAVEFLSCLGAMVGAVMLLNRMRSGLVVYMVSTIVYMLLTGAFMLLALLSIAGIPVALLQVFYLVPSMVLLLIIVQQRKYLV